MRFLIALALRVFAARLLAAVNADSPTNLSPFFPTLRAVLDDRIADGGISI